MEDPYEGTCPICVAPFSEEDLLFKPCPCGFRICGWCWHRIVESAGTAGESTVDMVPKCPNCRESFDVERALAEQQAAMAAHQKQEKHRQKRKAVGTKQSLVDHVYIDGKCVSLLNIPSDAFLPVVLQKLRAHYSACWASELEEASGGETKVAAAAPTTVKKGGGSRGQLAAVGADGLPVAPSAESPDAELFSDSSDDDEDSLTKSGGGGGGHPPLFLGGEPPCRSKRDLREVLQTALLLPLHRTDEDEAIIQLIVSGRNQFAPNHLYSAATVRLEALAPGMVAPPTPLLALSCTTGGGSGGAPTSPLTGGRRATCGVAATGGVLLYTPSTVASVERQCTSGGSITDTADLVLAAAEADRLAAIATNVDAAATGILRGRPDPVLLMPLVDLDGRPEVPQPTPPPPSAPQRSRQQMFWRFEGELWSWVEFLLPPTSLPPSASGGGGDFPSQPSAAAAAASRGVSPCSPASSTAVNVSPAALSSGTSPVAATEEALGGGKSECRHYNDHGVSAQYFNSNFFDAWQALPFSPLHSSAVSTHDDEQTADPLLGDHQALLASAGSRAARLAERLSVFFGRAVIASPSSANATNDSSSNNPHYSNNNYQSKQGLPVLFEFEDALSVLTTDALTTALFCTPVAEGGIPLTYENVVLLTQELDCIGHHFNPATYDITADGPAAKRHQSSASHHHHHHHQATAASAAGNKAALVHLRRAIARFNVCVSGASAKYVPSASAVLSSVLLILLHRRRQWQRWVLTLLAVAKSVTAAFTAPPAISNNRAAFATRRANISTAAIVSFFKSLTGFPLNYSAPNNNTYDLAADALAYFWRFGAALQNYLGFKEGMLLSSADRVTALRTYALFGRFGTITDADVYLHDSTLLLSGGRFAPEEDTHHHSHNHHNKDKESAAASSGKTKGGAAKKAGDDDDDDAHGSSQRDAKSKQRLLHQKHRTPKATKDDSVTTQVAGAVTSGKAASQRPPSTKWPAQLRRLLSGAVIRAALHQRDGDGGNGAPAAGPLLIQALKQAHLFSEDTSATVAALSPCQYYNATLRFQTAPEGTSCAVCMQMLHVATWGAEGCLAAGTSGVESAASVYPSSNIETIVAAMDSVAGMSPSAPLRLVRHRRPLVAGLCPTRFCSSFLRQRPCQREFCTDLHSINIQSVAHVCGAITVGAAAEATRAHFFPGTLMTTVRDLWRRDASFYSLSAVYAGGGLPVVVPSARCVADVLTLVAAAQPGSGAKPYLLKHVRASDLELPFGAIDVADQPLFVLPDGSKRLSCEEVAGIAKLYPLLISPTAGAVAVVGTPALSSIAASLELLPSAGIQILPCATPPHTAAANPALAALHLCTTAVLASAAAAAKALFRGAASLPPSPGGVLTLHGVPAAPLETRGTTTADGTGASVPPKRPTPTPLRSVDDDDDDATENENKMKLHDEDDAEAEASPAAVPSAGIIVSFAALHAAATLRRLRDAIQPQGCTGQQEVAAASVESILLPGVPLSFAADNALVKPAVCRKSVMSASRATQRLENALVDLLAAINHCGAVTPVAAGGISPTSHCPSTSSGPCAALAEARVAAVTGFRVLHLLRLQQQIEALQHVLYAAEGPPPVAAQQSPSVLLESSITAATASASSASEPPHRLGVAAPVPPEQQQALATDDEAVDFPNRSAARAALMTAGGPASLPFNVDPSPQTGGSGDSAPHNHNNGSEGAALTGGMYSRSASSVFFQPPAVAEGGAISAVSSPLLLRQSSTNAAAGGMMGSRQNTASFSPFDDAAAVPGQHPAAAAVANATLADMTRARSLVVLASVFRALAVSLQRWCQIVYAPHTQSAVILTGSAGASTSLSGPTNPPTAVFSSSSALALLQDATAFAGYVGDSTLAAGLLADGTSAANNNNAEPLMVSSCASLAAAAFGLRDDIARGVLFGARAVLRAVAVAGSGAGLGTVDDDYGCGDATNSGDADQQVTTVIGSAYRNTARRRQALAAIVCGWGVIAATSQASHGGAPSTSPCASASHLMLARDALVRLQLRAALRHWVLDRSDAAATCPSAGGFLSAASVVSAEAPAAVCAGSMAAGLLECTLYSPVGIPQAHAPAPRPLPAALAAAANGPSLPVPASFPGPTNTARSGAGNTTRGGGITAPNTPAHGQYHQPQRLQPPHTTTIASVDGPSSPASTTNTAASAPQLARGGAALRPASTTVPEKPFSWGARPPVASADQPAATTASSAVTSTPPSALASKPALPMAYTTHHKHTVPNSALSMGAATAQPLSVKVSVPVPVPVHVHVSVPVPVVPPPPKPSQHKNVWGSPVGGKKQTDTSPSATSGQAAAAAPSLSDLLAAPSEAPAPLSAVSGAQHMNGTTGGTSRWLAAVSSAASKRR